MKAVNEQTVASVARRVAEAIATDLEARLSAAYGPGWLSAVNARRAAAGHAPGRGLFDHRFCLAAFGYEPATEGWADEQFRQAARDLNALANKAAHDETISYQDIDRALQIAALFGVQGAEPDAAAGADQHGLDTVVDQALQDGDLEKAERACHQWLALEPDSTAALGMLGLVYRAAERWDDMLAVAGRWRRLDPANWAAAACAAQAQFALGRWDEVVDSCRVWLRSDPAMTNQDTWMLMGAAASNSGDSAALIEALEGALSLAPDEPRTWSRYTRELIRAESWDKALSASTMWLGLEPESEDARLYRAMSLSGARCDEEVVAFIERFWPQVPRLPDLPPASFIPDLLAIKAKALRNLGRHAEAVAAAANATHLNESLTGAWFTQAVSLHILGHTDGAIAAARRVLRDWPTSSDVWAILTRGLVAARRWEEALDAAEHWIEVEPHASAWSMKVTALLPLQRPAEARRAVEVMTALAPTDPGGLSLAVTAYVHLNDFPKALHYAERWAALEPESAQAQQVLQDLRLKVPQPAHEA